MKSVIPEFRDDGYLPTGLHRATDADILFRFGTSSRRRLQLALRIRRWIGIARNVHARRLLLDGSFVTSKQSPDDVDAVIWLPTDFELQIHQGKPDALELEQMLTSRQPEELFAAEDEFDWVEWVEFFSRTREPDGRRKGLVEIEL